MTLVSAVLVTRGRREWARQALDCFLAQTYEPKNCFVIDDADDPSFPNIVNHPNVGHVLLNERLSIPAKRNMAARLATGEILMHFDSDDWSAPERMADQVKRLEESGKMVTGYHSILFHDGNRAAKYEGHPPYACGTSLAYLKSFWESHNFNEGLVVHEDNHFVSAAQDCQQIVSVDAGQLMCARVHAGNTDKKSMDRFTAVPLEALPEGFPR